ncbi:MAG: hypothetical protein MUO52_02340 [Desulfobacterales bacterium]|nr:hypothetical protein [Desulfobacterales bacterium]
MKTRKNYSAIVGLAALALLLLTVHIQRSAAETTADQKNKANILRQFDYRVCTVQFDRVTFVNGVWIGKVQFREGNTDKAVLSCPLIHEYLQDVGNDGWELVACVSQRSGVNSNVSEDTTQTLFLKKEK